MKKASDSKFVTTKRNIFNDQSHANYDLGNEIIYNAKVLKSILYRHNHAYILVGGDITITEHNEAQVAFKNFASSIKGAATDMRYFARSKFFRSYVHKKNFSLI